MLQSAIAQITGGRVGVALLPLGGDQPECAGPEQVGAAWSTIKVPVVLARLRLADSTGERVDALTDRVRAAITVSDNEAAQSLFDEIAAVQGGVAGASLYVEQLLRDAGDGETVVNAERVFEEHSTFGQTQWSLSAGCRFFGALATGRLAPPDAARLVLELMGQVVEEQRWGLGRARFGGAAVHIKGGWGPDASGAHLVRQFGVVLFGERRGLVAGLMAAPADGSFESGVALVDYLADAVAAHVAASPSGEWL